MGESTAEPQRVRIRDAVAPGPGLGARARAALRALAEALLWDGTAPPSDAWMRWIVDELDDFARRAGTRARIGLRLLLFVVGVAAPACVGRLPPLRALPLSDRVRALERFDRTPLGLALYGLKALICLVAYEYPEAARRTGHDGRCLLDTHGPTAGATTPDPASEPAP
ncbi:MAG: hypothetical protein RMK74_05610 [Myxococcales bacterium]|nr:hypothetical protein [Myxococcales bacterium]